MKRKVIIDTDPGIDDTLAIALALASKELDVLAVSTVYGNVSLEHTTKNAELISDIFDSKVPIYSGASKPLVKVKADASDIHGFDGLGNLRAKYREGIAENAKAVEGLFNIYNIIKNSEEKVTIIAVGPLTNIATLLLFDESIKDNIEEIQVMGGGVNDGNTTEVSEFNFYSDSYAVDIVLNSGLPVYVSALNCTKSVYFTKEELSNLPENSHKQRLLKETIGFYAEQDTYLHDVCSVLMITHRDLFDTERLSLQVVSSDDLTDGMTYISNKKPDNVYFVTTKNREKLVNHVIEVIENEFA